MTVLTNADSRKGIDGVCMGLAPGRNSPGGGMVGVGEKNDTAEPPFNVVRISGHTVCVCRRRLQDRAHQSPQFRAVLERLAAAQAD